MHRFTRLYGASPLHLAGLLASLVVAGYAAVRLLGARPAAVLLWFVGAAVLHDLVLGPLYLPVYLLCGGVSARNPFERAADHYARFGHGWWP